MTALHVLFRVADTEYVLPADEVLHMESFTGATRVPGSASYVIGLVQVRSRVLPVVDLRLRFGLSAREPTLDSRILIVQHGTRAVGLLADSAREVLRIEPQQFYPPPELVVEQAAGFVTQVAELGSRLVMLIDSGKVIGGEAPHGELERAGWKDARNDPSKAIRFGDGSPLDRYAVQVAIDLAEELTFEVPWQQGDAVLVDNFLVMHGRRTFRGTRKVLASLAEPHTHDSASGRTRFQKSRV